MISCPDIVSFFRLLADTTSRASSVEEPIISSNTSTSSVGCDCTMLARTAKSLSNTLPVIFRQFSDEIEVMVGSNAAADSLLVPTSCTK